MRWYVANGVFPRTALEKLRKDLHWGESSLSGFKVGGRSEPRGGCLYRRPFLHVLGTMTHHALESMTQDLDLNPDSPVLLEHDQPTPFPYALKTSNVHTPTVS